MELRQMRYFVAVAEELHFGRAARRVHVAQPALSKQVMNLECELGVRLLDRRGRKVELTEAGRVFLERSRAILEDLEDAGLATARAGSGETGRLTVGFTGMALYGAAPQIVKTFGERFPGVDLALREMSTPAMVEALLGRRVDVGFLHPPVGEAAGGEVTVEVMASEPLIVALPEGHELCRLSEVPLSRLAEERFVIVPRDEGPELHDRIMGTCHVSGLSPVVANRNAPSQTTAIGLVAAGVAASLVWECMRNLRRPGVVYRPLAEAALQMQTALAWRQDDSSPVLREFVALAGEYAGKAEETEAGVPGDAALST
jgi:DNA-binding transcriptional LysR family regulator